MINAFLFAISLLTATCLLSIHSVYASDSISTTMRVPPLQWISLSNLTTGTNPPPLRDCTIGYDELTRTLMIFGGVSNQDGSFTSQQTFLLNLDSLVWSLASPSPGLPPLLSNLPPARSRAQAASDFAVNSRRSWIIWGGRGANGEALNDLWSYNFANQIWVESQLSDPRPSARWGAAGGSDLTHSLRVPNPPNFKNDLFFFGGSGSTASDPFSDAWHLTLDGTLSSNVQDVQANWTHLNWPVTLTSAAGESSAVLPSGSVAIYGGCTNTFGGLSNASCAVQDTLVMNPLTTTTGQPGPCPAPRLDASLTPNYSGGSQSFISQVFLLFGSFDDKQWNSSSAIFPGEVAILDTSSSLWSRILPSGDPISSPSAPTIPSHRVGAAVLSYPSGLVGGNRQLYSDTIVFGGQSTENGNLLDDLWILRAYNGSVSGNKQTWSGFGDGQLSSGIDADGRGVTVTYVDSCAQRALQNATSTAPSPGSPSTTKPDGITVVNASTLHKVFSPVAIALLLGCCVVHYISQGPYWNSIHHHLNYAVYALGFISIGCSVAGIIIAFVSVKSAGTESQQRKVEQLALHSAHGTAGLVISGALYVAVVVIFVSHLYIRRSVLQQSASASASHPHSSSAKASYPISILASFIRKIGDLRTEQMEERTNPVLKFEVTNRPKYARATSSYPLRKDEPPSSPRALSDPSWQERRRSLNTMGGSGFTLAQLEGPDTVPVLQHSDQRFPNVSRTSKYHFWGLLSCFLFHAVLLTNAIFSLTALWGIGHSIPFILFIFWLVSCYAIMCWNSRNQFTIFNGLRTRRLSYLRRANRHSAAASSTQEFPSCSASEERRNSTQAPHPTTFTGSNLLDSTLPMSVPIKATERRPIEDDEDDGAKQMRMEQEMQRRDVSIVTVPRRQLRIANA